MNGAFVGDAPERKQPKLKGRKCKICKTPFVPERVAQYVCGEVCAKEASVRIAAKLHAALLRRQSREITARRLAMRTLTQWLNAAQVPFNAFIRHRDRHLPCISCGKPTKGKTDAGHFLSVQSHPELRFDPDNVHKQCTQCNNKKGGNHHYFRLGVLAKIGPERVARLEGPRRPHQFTIPEAKDIAAFYRSALKD